MLSALLMLIQSAILTLRLGTNSGSFPRPLAAEEERKCVEAWTEREDLEARNKLVVHNLRLVAHIIKKSFHKRINFCDHIQME